MIKVVFSEHLPESNETLPGDPTCFPYREWVEEVGRKLEEPNKKNYCGYWDHKENGRETRYLLISRKLCELLNKSLCYNNCYSNCPVTRGDDSVYGDIIRNYETFFEKFFQFILRKFWELSPYLFPITKTKISLKDSQLKIQPYISVFWLLACEREIKEACYTILHSPYMTLTRETVFVPLSQVRQVAPEVVTSILAHPQYLIEDPQGIFCNPDTKGRYSPYRVAQFRKKEGFDIYENRVIKFILYYFLYLLKQILDTDCSNSIETKRQSDLRKKTEEFASWLDGFLRHTMWLETGLEFPLNLYSQVLLKRAGYRDLARIYFLLQHTPLPAFFARDDRFLELKRMDRLWEYYCLAVILDGFKNMGYNFNHPVWFEERENEDEYYEHAKIELYREGHSYRVTLTFQKEIREGRLRPDFYLESDRCRLVLDAKFRSSHNLHPCELFKYLRIWRYRELADNCLGLTLKDEALESDRNYVYRAIGYGHFASELLYRRPRCESASNEGDNEAYIKKVLKDFLDLDSGSARGEEECSNRGWLGYVPLEIPKV